MAEEREGRETGGGQQAGGEGPALGGEHGPVGLLRRQPLQALPPHRGRSDAGPARRRDRRRSPPRAGPPAPAAAGRGVQPQRARAWLRNGVVVGDGGIEIDIGPAQLGGHQHHLPALVDEGPQPGEGRRRLLGELQRRWPGPLGGQGQRRTPGRPPVLGHAVHQHAIEIEHQQGALRHR